MHDILKYVAKYLLDHLRHKSLMGFTLFVLAIFFTVNVQAHQPDHSFIYIRVYENTGIEGRFELNVNDINKHLGLNLPKNPNLEEVKPYEQELRAYILEHASFSSVDGAYEIHFTGELSKLYVGFGTFINFHFELEETSTLPDQLRVHYSVFLEENPNQINMLGVEYNWKAGLINNESIIALEFTEGEETQTLDLTDTSLWKGFVMMVKQGIWHIWIGLDHILFLLALILPSVVRRRKFPDGSPKKLSAIILGWEPVLKFRPAFIYIIKVITFFTIAHTITLSLAALEIINLPSRLVESVIALSIGLAAFHNIIPIFKGRDWIIAFGFGLFHGFGFASVLGDLGFRGEFLTLSLLGFNLGVEIGQVVIIGLIFPFLYLVRKKSFYPLSLAVLSTLLIVISLYWLIERSFDVDYPLDEKIIFFIKSIIRSVAEPLGIL